VSIELHACKFASNYDRKTDVLKDESFLRIFDIARRAGCKSHFGSDSHSFGDMDRFKLLQKQVDILGITRDDIHPEFRT
jgi:histidinol phosphatase-like PHP family hydrolase